MRLFKAKIFWLVVAILLGAAVALWLWQPNVKLPSAREASEFGATTSPPARLLTKERGELAPAATARPATLLESEINLAVPFAPQAPAANWEQPYQDACEEAAIIMIERYWRGAALSLEEMDVEILRLVDLQNAQFGFFKDSNIAETVRLAQAVYPELGGQAVYDITADKIREQLAAGRPVLVLADGRLLGNPYYTGQGPDKHALVIKGFEGDRFITNDPGTRRGADFVYSAEVLMNAIVDYDGATPGTGKKAMIILSPRVQ